MALMLEVTSYQGLPPIRPLSARFDTNGGAIGRSPDNHLTLPDQDKVISRHHGDIRYQNGAYDYTDVSTGGTLLCDSNRMLENGESVSLSHGDRIKIGEYELRIRIEEEAQAFSGLFPSLGDSQAFGNHGMGGDFNVLPLFGESEPMPILGQNVSPPHPARQNDSFINQADVSPFQESFTPPEVQRLPENFSFDPISLDVQTPAQATPDKPNDLGFPDHWFGDLGIDSGTQDSQPQPTLDPFTPSAAAPSATKESFPDPLPPADDDKTDFFAALKPSPVAFDSDITAVRPRHPSPQSPVAQEIISHEPPPVADFGEVSANLFAAPLPPAINLPKPGQPVPPSMEVAAVSAKPPPIAQTQPPHPASEASKGLDLFQCFLDGAGLTEFPKMTDAEQASAMKSLGAVYRDMVDGMMMVLRARSEEKREIRTDVTIIRKEKNNPLKFIPTVEDAMKVMISGKYTGYIDGTVAIREGFSDIMKHQMAMRAGLQAAVGEILEGFRPSNFEKPFDEGIVFHKKAKCWDAYSKAYPKLAMDAMDNLFSESFANAYEEQLRMLHNSRDKI